MPRQKGLLLLVLLFMLTIPVQAAGGQLPAGLIIGDQEGIHAGKDGEYFIHATNLRPGSVIRKTITIQNILSGDRTFYLYLQARPLDTTGPVNLLDETHLQLTMDGKTLYDGRMRGDGKPNLIDSPLFLGSYRSGDNRALEAVLSTDPDFKVSETKSTAEIAWIFSAIDVTHHPFEPNHPPRDSVRDRDIERESSSDLREDASIPQTEPLRKADPLGGGPDTGESPALLITLSALVISLFTLLYLCKKK